MSISIIGHNRLLRSICPLCTFATPCTCFVAGKGCNVPIVLRKCHSFLFSSHEGRRRLSRFSMPCLACLPQVDAHPFKHWYENHYGLQIGLKKGKKAPPAEEEVSVLTAAIPTVGRVFRIMGRNLLASFVFGFLWGT